MIFEITTREQFEHLRQKYSILIVDIYADWCGPCKAMSQGYDELSSRYSCDVIAFAKCNVETGVIEGISSVPTIDVIFNGEHHKRIFGANLSGIEELILQMTGAAKVQESEPPRSESVRNEPSFRPKTSAASYKTYGKL